VIDLRNVSWRYGEDEPLVLDGVDLHVEPGEFIGVVGATGSGKSTLAYAIRGMIPSFFEGGVMTGSVTVGDMNIAESHPQFSSDLLGMVFQDAASQAFGSTVLLDASFGPSNLGLPRPTVVERVRTYLERVRLSRKHEQSPATLSGGETQRLAIAGVLAMQPRVLILDEPVAELDPHGRKEVCQILDELRATHGATVVLIEQDPDLVARYADRILLMSGGRIARDGAPREVFADAEGCIELGVFPPETALIAQRLGHRAGLTFAQTPLAAGELVGALPAIEARTARAGETPAYGEVVLETRGLGHTYATGLHALAEVDLQVRRGEYLAVVGTNGAGKTTLTKHFNGILRPTTGTVLVEGEDIAPISTPDLAMSIGYCFQNPDHQIFASTVADEIEFGLKCYGIADDERASRVARIIEAFELDDLAETNPLNLGKGQRQKVALASILVLEPKILVIDEPTTGLDWQECAQILDILDRFHERGTTIVVVTHDMRLVRERAKRVVAMSGGRIAYDGPTSEFFFESDVLAGADIELTPVSELAALIAERDGIAATGLPITVDGMVELLAS
jgi:energy-coupling factor transporter ATP-binding protein EcfA2